MRRHSECETRRLPPRLCLLKGCGRYFRPEHHCCRYCSAECVEAARVWRRWVADQKYRATKHGKAVRKCQSERYRKRCPKETSHMRKSRKSRAVESNAAETPIPAAAPNTIVPGQLESAAPESAAPLNQAATKATPPLARVGDSQPTARKKSCCHRPGCYELFIPDPRTPDQKYCSPDCAQAMRRVLVREKRYRDRLEND